MGLYIFFHVFSSSLHAFLPYLSGKHISFLPETACILPGAGLSVNQAAGARGVGVGTVGFTSIDTVISTYKYHKS